MIYRKLSAEINRVLPYYSLLVITGPRQSGKTTLCKNHFQNYCYFNADFPQCGQNKSRHISSAKIITTHT